VPQLGLFGAFRVHSCLRSHQRLARYPQIGQRKQGGDLRRIPGQSLVANLHNAKLAENTPEVETEFFINSSPINSS